MDNIKLKFMNIPLSWYNINPCPYCYRMVGGHQAIFQEKKNIYIYINMAYSVSLSFKWLKFWLLQTFLCLWNSCGDLSSPYFSFQTMSWCKIDCRNGSKKKKSKRIKYRKYRKAFRFIEWDKKAILKPKFNLLQG